MTEHYMKLADIRGALDLNLFRGIVHSKNRVKLCAQGGLSYTRVHELLLEKLAYVRPKKLQAS